MEAGGAGGWCSGGGGLRVVGRLVSDGGVAGEHQGVRVNSVVAPTWSAMAHGLLATQTHVYGSHGTGDRTLWWRGEVGEGHVGVT
jgi:hypothetical protein